MKKKEKKKKATYNYTIEQLEAMQQKFYKKGLQAAMDLAVAVPMMVLRDYYDFNREQLEDFATHYSDMFDSVDKGYLNIEDMIKTLEEEIDLKIIIKE